jgi:preprotein translocase subunit SecA
VMNDQRKVVYEQRRELMEAEDVSDTVVDMRHQVIEDLVARHIPEKAYPEQWDVGHLQAEARRSLALDLPVADWAKEEGIADQEIRERLLKASDDLIAEKTARYGEPLMRSAEKSLLLQILDHLWKEHLLHLDHLRQGIHLRGYAQRDPLNEYKREAFDLFEAMLNNLRQTVTQVISHLEVRVQQPEPEPPRPPAPVAAQPRARALAMAGGDGDDLVDTIDRGDPSARGKVPRNAPCPCGSGRKFKQCHGRIA